MPLRSDAVARVRIRSLIVLIVLVVSMATAVPATGHAGHSHAGDAAAAETDIFDENESESTIRWVTRALVGIAAGTGLLLVVYIWHTSPRRRLRVATRRRERREASRRLGLEDEFVLPDEVGGEPGDRDESGADDVDQVDGRPSAGAGGAPETGPLDEPEPAVVDSSVGDPKED